MSDWPKIRTVGLSGLLITFSGAMSEPANRAALAFRAEVAAQEWPECANAVLRWSQPFSKLTLPQRLLTL
jgi:hypothetical protein